MTEKEVPDTVERSEWGIVGLEMSSTVTSSYGEHAVLQNFRSVKIT